MRPGPAPGLIYAGFWIRVGAALIDLLIVFGTLIAIGAVLGAVSTGSGTGGDVVAAVVIVAGLLSYLALQIGIPGRYGGTVGMRALGIWIVREQDGSQIGYALAAGRFGVWLVLAVLPFGSLADALLVAFDQRKQAIHDKACSTLAIRRAS